MEFFNLSSETKSVDLIYATERKLEFSLRMSNQKRLVQRRKIRENIVIFVDKGDVIQTGVIL